VDALEGTTGLAVYLSLKLSGYLLWSYVAVKWLSPAARRPLFAGAILGTARMVLGWLVGIAVTPLVLAAGTRGQLPLFYFTGLGLIRWLEWGVIQSLIPGAGQGSRAFLTGASLSGRVWRGLGVLVSYIADAPFLISHGFPQGRFLC
jgi:hypothetical protein